MKKQYLYILAGMLLTALIFSIVQLTQAGTPGVSHTTDEIGSGTFQSGNYTFPDNLGIGVADPSYKLDIVSGGATTARFGTNEADNVLIGDGAGKLTVGLIDPLFNIQGNKYATFLPGMTGIKEEATGVVQLVNGEYVIDFNELEQGSDLWIFYRVTDFGKNWEKLIVLLTAEGPGEVWYKKKSMESQLIIYSETATSVSYRLTAPRFDWNKWPNIVENETATGLMVDEIVNEQYTR